MANPGFNTLLGIPWGIAIPPLAVVGLNDSLLYTSNKNSSLTKPFPLSNKNKLSITSFLV